MGGAHAGVHEGFSSPRAGFDSSSLGGPSWGVHADLVTIEIFQCKEFSVKSLSLNFC